MSETKVSYHQPSVYFRPPFLSASQDVVSATREPENVRLSKLFFRIQREVHGFSDCT